jgi:hypothetical protein
VKNPNWEKLDGLTKGQEYRLLLELTQTLKPEKMDQLIRGQKLLSMDSAMWSEAWSFKQLCKRSRAT